MILRREKLIKLSLIECNETHIVKEVNEILPIDSRFVQHLAFSALRGTINKNAVRYVIVVRLINSNN